MLLTFIKKIPFLTFIKKIPFLQSLIYFTFASHKVAIKKFIILWVLSSMPIIVAILLSPVPDGDLSLSKKLIDRLYDSVSISEAFVYAAAFMSPIFYILIGRIQDMENEDSLSEKMKVSFKSIFKGYGLVFIIALISLLLTAVAYSSIKTDVSFFNGTFLHHLIKNHVHWLYIYALFCWYMSILAADGNVSNFVTDNRNAEKKLTDEFHKRVNPQGGAS